MRTVSFTSALSTAPTNTVKLFRLEPNNINQNKLGSKLKKSYFSHGLYQVFANSHPYSHLPPTVQYVSAGLT